MQGKQAVGILAGGEGVRIGGDKPFKLLKGKPLFLWVYSAVLPLKLKVYLSVRTLTQGERLLSLLKDWGYPEEGVEIVLDQGPFAGPLAGIFSLLSSVEEEEILVVTCDQPLLPTEILKRLLEDGSQGKVTLYQANQKLYPFPMKIPKKIFPHLRTYLEGTNKPSIFGFLNSLDIIENLNKIEIKKENYFVNVNTLEDLFKLENV